MVEEEKVEMKLMSLVKTMNEKWGVLEEAWLGDFVEFLLNGQFNQASRGDSGGDNSFLVEQREKQKARHKPCSSVVIFN